MPDDTRASLRVPHAILMDEEGKVVEEHYQCPHCQRFWTYKKGSGRKHKFCMNCGANTCSRKKCMTTCLPYEKRLDLFEAGKIKVL